MGYAFMVSECYTCGGMFTFNPVKVPSVRDKNNVRQPICRHCVEDVNKLKAAQGMELFVIPKDAYTACDETELD